MGIKQLLLECEKNEARNRSLIEELKSTIEHYRVLADLSPDCILIIDRELLVRYMNATASRYLGKDPDQIFGKPLRPFPGERPSFSTFPSALLDSALFHDYL